MNAKPQQVLEVKTPRPTFAFEQSLEATQDAVREALAYFIDQLSTLVLPQDDLETVELVLAETLNNIVEHAFADQTEPGFIRIRCVCQRGVLYLRITDFGKAMPGLMAPAGSTPAMPIGSDDLPEGGFGWGLIRTLTDDVSYVRSGPMNALTLQIPLNKG